MVRVGCCGFPLSRAEYYRRFSVVEVQQTFYRPPRPETAERWRREAPEGFVFTLKAWQVVTHPATSPTYRRSGLSIAPEERHLYGLFRPTVQVAEGWQRTLQVARALKASVVVLQCPASFRPTGENVANMRRFLSETERDGLTIAWEPRGPWDADLVRDLCRELDLVHCTDPFEAKPLWGDIVYLRVHGGPGYRRTFGEEELSALARAYGPRQGYIMFNNLNMLRDATRLREILQEQGFGER